MKKILGVALGLAVCVFTLAGCHSSDEPAESSVPKEMTLLAKTEKLKSKEEKGEGIPKEKIKIGMIHFTDPAEGSGYTYTHDLGIQEMQENLGLSDEQIVRKNNVDEEDMAAVKEAVLECVEEGCNIIFAASYGNAKAIAEMAEQYPEVYFSLEGSFLNNGRNLNSYYGKIYQARYLSGIAAGLKTETNKIGYVAAWGMENPEVTGGLNAFAMGVASVNESARIYVKVTNSWFDPEKEKEAAGNLIVGGCDVIAQHCDTPNPQLAAEEAGVWGIGYNSDMSKDAPDTVLVSVMWDWSVYYTYVIQSLIDGTWDSSDYLGGMKEGLVKLSGLAVFNAPEAAARIEEAQIRMFDGSFSVFDGVIETNEGTYIGEEGTSLSDEEIIEGMDWYYKNVVNEQ